MAKQPIIERFPTLVQFRDRVKKRVEEARARVKELREGGGSKSQLVREIREKGIAETIRARREKRLAKASRRSPVIEEPKVRVYSETESPVVEEPRVKTYTAPIKTY